MTIRDLSRRNTREWHVMPYWLKEDLCEYIDTGYIEVGTTLYYALCNDFSKTVCVAGDDVYPVVRELGIVLYNYIPEGCWGSYDKVNAWRVYHAERSRLKCEENND